MPGYLIQNHLGLIRYAPIIFLFFTPFIPMNIDMAKIIHLSLNIIAACGLAWLFFKKARMLDNFDYRKPNVKALLILSMTFIFLNSTPVIMTFRHGQNTIFITLFLVLCLFCRSQWAKVILFSLVAVIKYTMLPLLAPALFLKKNYLFCIVSFLVFLLFTISPVFCGHNIITLYSRYADLILQYVSNGGFNTYVESGYSMLNISFFKLNIINVLGKSLFGLLAVYIIFRDRRQNSFGMNFLLVIMCVTMLVSYHRLHDIPLIMLIILAEFYFFMLKKDKINMLISAIFILFFAVPFTLIIKISHLLCRLPNIGNFIQTGPSDTNIEVFPLSAAIFLLLTVYSLCLYFFKQEDVVFELNESKPDGENR